MKKMFHYTLWGILFTSVLGTLSHFFYEWSGNNFFVGLFTPVNESTWEHMKLLFFPMLFYCIIEQFAVKAQVPFINCANAAGILAGTISIPVLFYAYSGILGNHYTVLDIALFYICVIIAFAVRYRFIKHKTILSHSTISCRWLEAAVILLFLCFIIFTVAPPDIGIFKTLAFSYKSVDNIVSLN